MSNKNQNLPVITSFFDSNLPLNKDNQQRNIEIISLLNKNKCNVIQTVIGVDISFADMPSSSGVANYFQLKVKDIKDSDLCVFEMSIITPTIMMEFIEAINSRKAVLVIYDSDISNSKKQEYAIFSEYSSYVTVCDSASKDFGLVVANFIENSVKLMPVNRFTVRLNAVLSDYLEKLKPDLNCNSKNDVVIKILEQMMQAERQND
jgi:hypothetical protein